MWTVELVRSFGNERLGAKRPSWLEFMETKELWSFTEGVYVCGYRHAVGANHGHGTLRERASESHALVGISNNSQPDVVMQGGFAAESSP